MGRPKIIREAIHGDIRLEPHELDVINTRVFQRLHGIKQLGMSHLVYPTAVHTRFQHALGCVHVAHRIIDQLQHLGDAELLTASAKELGQDEHAKGFPIPPDLRDKIRMAALLHDLAHIPYGHTLEDELGLLAEHDDASGWRLSRFVKRLKDEIESDPAKDAARAIPLVEYALDVMKTIKLIDEQIRDGKALEETAIPLPPQECFVADIIGNTVCADLLDYARRDMRATGLNQDYDDRLYSYFDLARDEEGRVRLALRTTKDQGLRLDAVSEVLHVLRIRYTLSERVLFHHTKNVASAMLGAALSYIKFGSQAFDDMRDEQLLPWIRSEAEAQGLGQDALQAVDRVVSGLESRRLHKTIFRVGPAQQLSYQLENARHMGTVYADVDKRQELELEIRGQIPQLRPGDLIIYCPKPQMTMKEVWVNVLARKGDQICRPLRAEASEKEPYLPHVVADEVRALEEKYRELWSWTVMLAPEILNYAFAIQAFIQQTLHVSNDPFLQSYLERRDDLHVGREIMKHAAGDYAVQAKAVEMALEKPEELEKAVAAAGPETQDSIYQDFVDRARREVYYTPEEAP